MKPDWREEQMCDIAFDMFLEDSKYDETENAIFTLMHKAFLEGFKAGTMASESIDRMSMYYKGRIDARIANAGFAEKANGQNNID